MNTLKNLIIDSINIRKNLQIFKNNFQTLLILIYFLNKILIQQIFIYHKLYLI